MFDVKWDLKGFDRVSKKLQELPVAMRGKPGRSALGSAVRVMTNKANDNALRVDDPLTGRRIADNIVQRFRSKYFKRTGDLMISVGVGTAKGRIPRGNPDEGPKGNTYHWHLVELGTEKMKAQPFLRPTFQQTSDKVQQVFAEKLEKQIDKIAKT